MKVRLTRVMACMREAPRIGLSTYMVCIGGESKPVSHMSRTMTSSNLSSGFVARSLMALRSRLFRMWGWNSEGSAMRLT